MIIYGILEKDQKIQIITLVVGFTSILIYPIILEVILNIKAKLLNCRENIELHYKRHLDVYKKKIPIAYSEDYNITAGGIEKCHPFDSCKYGRGN